MQRLSEGVQRAQARKSGPMTRQMTKARQVAMRLRWGTKTPACRWCAHLCLLDSGLDSVRFSCKLDETETIDPAHDMCDDYTPTTRR